MCGQPWNIPLWMPTYNQQFLMAESLVPSSLLLFLPFISESSQRVTNLKKTFYPSINEFRCKFLCDNELVVAVLHFGSSRDDISNGVITLVVLTDGAPFILIYGFLTVGKS